MKPPFEVLWAAAAESDLLGIVDFIAKNDPGTALQVLNKIKAGTARLEESPRRGRVVPELLKQGISRYREIVIKPWRVIYRIEVKRVYVLCVIDGRRNVEDVLLSRLLR
jgi:plasmid stabilization system protein ParE